MQQACSGRVAKEKDLASAYIHCLFCHIRAGTQLRWCLGWCWGRDCANVVPAVFWESRTVVDFLVLHAVRREFPDTMKAWRYCVLFHVPKESRFQVILSQIF